MRINRKINSFRTLGLILSLFVIFGTFQELVVKAVDSMANDADLVSITINGQMIDTYRDTAVYNLNLSTNTAIDNLTVTAESSDRDATVNIEGTEVENNLAVVKITVISESGLNTKIYYVVVHINGGDSVSNNADLISITVNGQKINIVYPYMVNYNLDLPYNTGSEYLSVETEASDKNSTVNIEGTKVINNSALVKITVTAQNKLNTRVYYVNVQIKDGAVNNGFIDVKTADFHTLALKNDGTLYSFGDNKFGQLGDGTKASRIAPGQIKNITNVVDFDTSNSHSIAVTSDGSVWTWGLNDFGQLGIGNRTDALVPTKVEGLSSIVKVRAGNRINAALDKYGQVWTWGYNSKGLDDDIINPTSLQPGIVKELSKEKIIDIAVGDFHFLALNDKGKVYSWGINDFGQLGDETLYNKYTPAVIEDLEKVKFISADGNTSSCVTEDGRAYYWGEIIYNEDGTIGVSTAVSIPELIDGVSEAQSIEVNNNHIIYIKKNGSIYSKGINKYGQLGDGSTSNKNYFSQVYRLSRINKVTISKYSSFFIDEGGYIYSSGRNDVGQLGINQAGGVYSTPKKLESFSTSSVTNVYANYKSGEVDRGTAVRLGTDAFNSKIYYTLDGSNPTDKSMLYKTPIVINEYTVIKAVALKDGKYSAVSTFEYLISNKARTEMNITIGGKEGKLGDYVDIPVTFSNVPIEGISNVKFAVKFNPEILSFQSVTKGGLVTDSSDFSYTKPSNDTILLSFYDNSRTSRNISQNGTFATLRFYIRSNAALGRYSIARQYTSEEGVNLRSGKAVNVYYNDGYIDAVSTNSTLLGDVDGDGKVTALDLQYMQRYISNKITSFPNSSGRERADIDKDGDVDSNDVELVKKIILNSH